MKVTKQIFLIVLIGVLGLAACGGGGETAVSSDTPNEAPRLAEGDLSVNGQLAVGTIQLEETDLAVDETQAAELLTLWQALQTLSQSDTAADVEIDALLNQIQDTMTPAQIETIAAMALTEESLEELQASGQAAFGGFGGRGRQVDEEGEGSDGRGGGFGGGPPGGVAPGSGLPGGSLDGGLAGGEIDEDTLATRQAQMESGEVQEMAFTNMVVRLLQTKTGAAPANARGGDVAGIVFQAAGEATGLTTAELRQQIAEGSSLAEIIAANGGDVTVVRETVAAELEALPNADELDIEQLLEEWLGE